MLKTCRPREKKKKKGKPASSLLLLITSMFGSRGPTTLYGGTIWYNGVSAFISVILSSSTCLWYLISDSACKRQRLEVSWETLNFPHTLRCQQLLRSRCILYHAPCHRETNKATSLLRSNQLNWSSLSFHLIIRYLPPASLKAFVRFYPNKAPCKYKTLMSRIHSKTSRGWCSSKIHF